MIMALEDLIKQQLSEKRYTHSVRVAQTAVELAKAHSVDEEKAYTAGILHDYCKEYSKQEQIKIAVEQRLLTSREDLLMPQVLHGPVASYVLKAEGIVDAEDILQAVRFHTTGHPDMDVLAKIIFIADYIEPGRKTPNLDGLLECALNDLDECMVEIIDRTALYLLEKRKIIHEDMIKCRNKILSKE